MKTNIENNYILKGLIIGFLVGVMFIPFLLIAHISLPKNFLYSFLVGGITIIVLLIYYSPTLFYSIINDVFIRADNDFLLIGFIIIFYTTSGLIMGTIYHIINKKSKTLSKIILFIIVLLFLFFNLFLSTLTIG